MSLTDVEHLAVALVAVALLAALAFVAVLGVRLRNRWRRRRRLTLPLSGVTESLAGTVGSPAWWFVQRDRHTMWRSVASAQRAVTVAARADAPLGDLPLLMRQLRKAATGVDAALRASGDGRRAPRHLTQDRLRIETAAAEIRAAAIASLEVARVDVQPVVSAVAVEVAALSAGIQAARSR